MVQAIRHRVGQFFRALSPQVPEQEIRAAIQPLAPGMQELFRRQETQDQRHALAVFRALRRAGHTDAHLLNAALLHDVGKAAAPCPPWVRAIAVLMGQFAPSVLDHLTLEEPHDCQDRATGWRRALVAHVRHAEVGARWAQEAGCSDRTVALIQRHREHAGVRGADEDGLLVALQAADSVN